MNKSVWATFQVEGVHQWPDADNYLKYPHRHMFHFMVKISVTDSDREIEFIKLGQETKGFVERNLLSSLDVESFSCEFLAEAVVHNLVHRYGNRDYTVTVSEDGENGAEVSSLCSSR